MNHYEILGVTPDAHFNEIRSSYRKLVKQYHPDLNPSPSAADLIVKITHAYDVLSDPAKKISYDLLLNGQVGSPEEYMVDPREQYRREYVRRKRHQEEKNWQQLFHMKVKFYKMQRYFAVVFMLVAMIYAYDFLVTEVWAIRQVTKVVVNRYGEAAIVCGETSFNTDASFYSDWNSANAETVNIHFSWLHGTPVGLSFDGSDYYRIHDTVHSFGLFFPLLLIGISLLLLVYHEYSDGLLTIGLLPFFITMFLLLLSYITIHGGY